MEAGNDNNNHKPVSFNEQEWLKLLFLLNDTQEWLDEMSKQAFAVLPLTDKRKLFRKTYCLTAPALTHIIERHYYKITRHPGTGKFHIPLLEILHLILEAAGLAAQPIPGCLSFQRILETENIIGFDKNGNPAKTITILTNPAGKIITAFPGT